MYNPAEVELANAVSDGNLREIIEIIKDNIGINRNPRVRNMTWSAMHFAAYNGHVSILEALTKDVTGEKLAAMLNVQGQKGLTPLHLAVDNRQLDVVSFLLQHKGTLVDVYNDELTVTPLIIAMHKGYYNAVKLLINRGAFISKYYQWNDLYKQEGFSGLMKCLTPGEQFNQHLALMIGYAVLDEINRSIVIESLLPDELRFSRFF